MVGSNFSSNDEIVFEDFRAPRAHLESLVQPPVQTAQALIDGNIERASSYPSVLSSLQKPAREQLIRDAVRYTSAYRDSGVDADTTKHIVMAGHQPTLFHPGVWFKNISLDHVARLSDAVAVNLVVDSDVAGSSSVRVPTVADGQIGYTNVPYDDRGGGVPYEQALVRDRAAFDQFDSGVTRAVRGVVDDPLVGQLWRHAQKAIDRCGYAGCALAQARHGLESELDLRTLEIPQSVVCRCEPFADFATQILMDLPRFHACYNDSADLYRRIHGIRSNAHPVPNLKQEEDWYEAPFWLYGNQSPKRRGVWARRSAGGTVLEITDRESRTRKIHCGSGDSVAEAFGALASPEFKLRSRALVTTMYARLVLSDLFLHGIGGGKYDQLGDLISRSFWGIDPPEFMVISATVQLPGHDQISSHAIENERRLALRQKRDLQFQGERFAKAGALPEELLERKRELLNQMPSQGQRAEWHQAITGVNREMESHLVPLTQELETKLTSLNAQRKQASIWTSREQSFCVYPIDYLKQAYQAMLR